MPLTFPNPFHLLSQYQIKQMDQQIKGMTEGALSNANIEELVEQFTAKFGVEMVVLELDEERWTWTEVAHPPESGEQPFVVLVPFSGEARLFEFSGYRHPLIYEDISVTQGALRIVVSVSKAQPEDAIQRVRNIVNQVEHQWRKILEPEVTGHNDQVRERARLLIHQRCKGVIQQQAFRQKMATLVQLNRRNDGAEKVILALDRKSPPNIVKPTEPKANPEPQITMESYEDILSTITAMAHVLERSPKTFQSMTEEDLRMILLVALNGIYRGEGTGETFNGAGKTDILIRHQDRNVFIAECLIWGGQELLRKKLDEQLFGYATWRDSRLAVIVFNRNKGFSEVVTKMKEVCEGHPLRVSTTGYAQEGAGRYIFRRADDAQRQFVLTALAFDIPTK
jgi:hypothetical protein